MLNRDYPKTDRWMRTVRAVQALHDQCMLEHGETVSLSRAPMAPGETIADLDKEVEACISFENIRSLTDNLARILAEQDKTTDAMLC